MFSHFPDGAIAQRGNLQYLPEYYTMLNRKCKRKTWTSIKALWPQELKIFRLFELSIIWDTESCRLLDG